jgi:uncharacterized protein
MSDGEFVFAGQIFEWDTQKASENLGKHGVGFEEAASAFADPWAGISSDPDHSWHEDRFILVGESAFSRILMVVAVERTERVRLISARVANASERKAYDQSKFERAR